MSLKNDWLIKWQRPLFATALTLGLGTLGLSSASANDRSTIRSLNMLQSDLDSLKLNTPLKALDASPRASRVLDPSLVGATGRHQIIVRLGSEATGSLSDESDTSTQDQKDQLQYEQSDFLQRYQSRYSSIQEIGRVQHVLNAVFLDVPAEALTELAGDPAVSRIAPVAHYRLELSDTVPSIGASKLHNYGLTGRGVTVAVIDSGIDYTHADLGGSGDPDEYLANDGDIIEPGTFPTAKVIGGYDFLGSVWPTGAGGASDPPSPDPDPFDDFFSGHGTHVADIIGGVNGVAPNASLYALKVCSSQASSCNGISMIMAMDYAVDPNGDGDTSDHVDIINLSLGSDYGQSFDDDLATAVENASALGVLTVSSAGNCGDQPYCTGSPSSARSALSVAQTHVPSAMGYYMEVLEPEAAADLYDAAKYDWTPSPTEAISGSVQYADLDGGNLDGCLAFTGDLSGMVVAVDRGGCFFSDKIRNIEEAGGILGIVMLIAPGAPFSGAFGGGDPITIPGFSIDVNAGDIIRGGGAVVEFSPELSYTLDGSTVSSTARGPDMSYNSIKPEIGAPGASLSAEVGSGTERTPFGGTSGASPMVAGAAALLQQSCRRYGRSHFWRRHKREGCKPHTLKTLLVNNAFRDIISDTTGELSEITRIGGGEVRVDAAASAGFMVFNKSDKQPTLSLGHVDVDQPITIRRKLVVKNLSWSYRYLYAEPSFRFFDDEDSGAVSVELSKNFFKLRPFQSKVIKVDFTIDPSFLAGNAHNSGGDGNNPAALSANEFDGYIVFNDWWGDEVAVPWHVMPRQAANVSADRSVLDPEAFPDTLTLTNDGAGIAQNDAFAIIALSDEVARGGQGEQMPTPDIRAVGVNTALVESSVCSSEFLWQFAINTWDRQTHLSPVSHQIGLDLDQDGVEDYLLLNRDITFDNVTDGRQVSWSYNIETGEADAFFFAEHSTNTGNTILRACGEQFGLGAEDLLATSVNLTVTAQDFYYGGPGDFIDGITVSPLAERFFGIPSADILGGEMASIEVYDFEAFPGNSEESGIMLISNGDRGTGAHGGATEDSEMLLLLSPEATGPTPLP